MKLPDPPILHEAIQRALGEDCGPMDITSFVAIEEHEQATARIITREDCVVAGLPLSSLTFQEVDPSLQVRSLVQEGERISAGTPLQTISGSLRSLLTGERVALNFLQRLCGIATQTRRFADAVSGTNAKILDTRKTTPGLRALEKYAVRCGGGTNHRFGLFDQFLFKDNHLALLGTGEKLKKAIARARSLEPEAKIEVEADTLKQVEDIVKMGVDLILLDNMSNRDMTEAVKLIAGRAKTEASGNMTLDRIPSVAATGVDFISVGSLTHSVRAIDLGLDL